MKKILLLLVGVLMPRFGLGRHIMKPRKALVTHSAVPSSGSAHRLLLHSL